LQEQLADVAQVVGAQAQINLDAGAALDRLKVLIEDDDRPRSARSCRTTG
jgi:hypothetical protein